MYTVVDAFRVKDMINHRLSFKVPLDYQNPNREITIVVNITQKHSVELHKGNKFALPAEPKLVCYVQGGPGFPCGAPSTKSGYTEVLLDNGYQVVFLDQRGTGMSTPLEAGTLEQLVPKTDGELEEAYVQRQLEFVLNFRADSIVEDYEVVRRALLKDGKWSLLGQSYGGFCSFAYLLKYPDALREVMVTGGVPPINHGADEVYTATYQRTKERNVHYYTKYPGDVGRVKRIMVYLAENKVILPNGGTLSVERFQQLGLSFGSHGGTDEMHQLVLKFDFDLEQFGRPTFSTLTDVELKSSFDTNVIYALFQEAIYCDGHCQPTRWSADRLRYLAEDNYVFSESLVASDKPVYFTGEMVYKSMFDDYVHLKKFKELAYQLHSKSDWSQLYDVDVLLSLTWEKVPIVAATYVYDQYVDFDVTMKVKKELFQNGNLKQYITSEFFHGGIRADPKKVLGLLLSLINNGEID